MEDPWANAWGEPTKSQNESWTHAQNPETDIALSSWATSNSDVKWSDPSDPQQPPWNSQLPVKEWNPSTYDAISVGQPSQVELSPPDRSPSPIITAEEISSPPLSSPVMNMQSLEPSSLPIGDESAITRSHSPIPDSPDVFGTFETGLDVDEAGMDPWGHAADLSVLASGEADAWVATWGEDKPKAEVEVDNESVDEWEAAKQRKEKQDRHIPPEVLNSILGQFEELTNDLWPKTTEDNDTSIPGFRHERQNGIEGIEGIKDVVDRLIPQDLTLPQHVQFSKTFTSKHMNEALRLTRHMETMRSSPMALYMASKGSTAWETSVKSRPEILKDDLLPPGWRIMEKEEPTPATDNKKKMGGGLLSFFGRRGNPAPSSEANPKHLESSVRPVRTPPPGVANTNSPRPSVDDIQSSPSGPGTSSPVRPSSTSFTASENPAFIPTPPPVPPPAPPLPPQAEIEPAPPSAVSRFLNRFSRNKASGSVPRNSLALSSDDLEFLSDIVPSANEEGDEDLQLKGLSNMIASSPLPTKLPPPLPPPPMASALSSLEASSWSKSPTMNDDLLSLSSSTGLEVPHISETQQPSVSLSFPNVPVASSSPSPISTLAPSSFGTASKPGSTFSSPPTSRSHTPLSSKRTPTAIMSTTSSAIPTGSGFSFPPPPSSSTQPLVLPPPPGVIGTPSKLMQHPPPSKLLSPMPSMMAKTLGSTNGDEFSSFYQPPSRALAAFDTSLSSAFSDDSLMHTSSSSTTAQSSDPLDDFDDFISSPLRTPSPPRPPQKPMSFGHKPKLSQQFAQPSLRSISPDKPQPPLPRKTSRAADHQRTMSLLEIAAARPGRWPAPPSPLPDAIPLPGASEPSFDSDLFAGGSTMQNQQVNAIASLGASVSSPASLSLETSTSRPPSFPPVPSATLSPSPLHLRAKSPPIQLKPQASTQIPVTSSTFATSGGLSAQDLSFFEGP